MTCGDEPLYTPDGINRPYDAEKLTAQRIIGGRASCSYDFFVDTSVKQDIVVVVVE
jgi:hypothetical protein